MLTIDRETGKIIRDQKLFDIDKPQYCIPFNSYASCTPAIEEGRIYVTFAPRDGLHRYEERSRSLDANGLCLQSLPGGRRIVAANLS